MQIRNMHAMNIANDGFLSSARASSPRISPTDTFCPTFLGGVCGRVKREQAEHDATAPPAR